MKNLTYTYMGLGDVKKFQNPPYVINEWPLSIQPHSPSHRTFLPKYLLQEENHIPILHPNTVNKQEKNLKYLLKIDKSPTQQGPCKEETQKVIHLLTDPNYKNKTGLPTSRISIKIFTNC